MPGSNKQKIFMPKTKNRSSLTKERLSELFDLVCKNYLADSRPWVLGYSGGKDSSCVLQLIWQALARLPEEQRTKPVFVLSSDTLVEAPAIVNQLSKAQKQINKAAQEQNMPFKAHVVVPEINNTFWVNLIGRGYPAPYKTFRWCTDRMKIAPATTFIKAKVAQYGEVTILLGARRAESSSRGQVMANRVELGNRLSRHKDLPNAWVFTPIEDWVADDVWTYLINTPSPWGYDNNELVTMYRNAQSGECPLVIDKSTPSCGGGRFGCWTCTVVQRDRSMEAMIENGETWMQPMLDFRDWLTATQDPAKKKNIREHRRRTGRVEFGEKDGKKKIIWGPYKLTVRQEILRRLLKAQIAVRAEGPDPMMELIQKDELHKIRQLWIHEEGDWEDTLPNIYEEIVGESVDWLVDDASGLGGVEKELLTEICAKHNLNPLLLTELFDVEQAHQGMTLRAGIYNKLGSVLRKDWRTREEALSEIEEELEVEEAVA
jgi:DNA sulfur modification protein DndC